MTEKIRIENAWIVDGTGRERFLGDLLVADGKIAEIGKVSGTAERVISGKGKILCPGFIDIHRHCDGKFLGESDFADVLLSQGITTTVVGNCGISLTPSPAESGEMYDFMEAVLGGGCADLGLHSYPDYLKRLDKLDKEKLPLNVASMVGTGSVKITVKGFSDMPFTEKEMDAASGIIKEALSAGAAGVSCGIMYIPECYSTTAEFVRLLKPLGETGKPLTCHIRGEGDSLFHSVSEVIEIGRQVGCPVHISHFKCCGLQNWGKGIFKAIQRIEDARAAGQDVTCDFYPYEGGSTALTTMLPPAFVGGDMKAALLRLGTTAGVEEYRKMSRVLYSDWDNYCVTLGWERILISGVAKPHNRKYVGLSVQEAAERFGFSDGASCAAYLMHDEEGKTAIILMSMLQSDIDAVARLPYSLVISDAIYADTDTPHPRMYGSFPKILREYVGERKILTLEEAVRKMTALPATRMNLRGRGVLELGGVADLLLFDLAEFRDYATFGEPTRLSEGLSLMLIGGVPVWENGRRLNSENGQNLRIL